MAVVSVSFRITFAGGPQGCNVSIGVFQEETTTYLSSLVSRLEWYKMNMAKLNSHTRAAKRVPAGANL